MRMRLFSSGFISRESNMSRIRASRRSNRTNVFCRSGAAYMISAIMILGLVVLSNYHRAEATSADHDLQATETVIIRPIQRRTAQEQEILQSGGGAASDSACLKGLLDALSPAPAAQLNSSTDHPLSTWTSTALASPCMNINPTNSSTSTLMTGITCDVSNSSRVISISLPSANLVGTLPSSLSLCSSLATLNLSGNFLTGAIPTSLGALSSLSTLSLSHNQLSGAIPLELSTCFPLSSLDLRNNQLSGSIPGQLGLVPLQFFNVSYNRLSGLIPSTLSNTSTGAPRFDASSFMHNSDLHGYPLPDHAYSQQPSSIISDKGVNYWSVLHTVGIVVAVGAAVVGVFGCFLIVRICMVAREHSMELAQRDQRLRQTQAAASGSGRCRTLCAQQEDGWKQVLSQL